MPSNHTQKNLSKDEKRHFDKPLSLFNIIRLNGLGTTQKNLFKDEKRYFDQPKLKNIFVFHAEHTLASFLFKPSSSYVLVCKSVLLRN